MPRSLDRPPTLAHLPHSAPPHARSFQLASNGFPWRADWRCPAVTSGTMTQSGCVFNCTRPPPPRLPERGLSPEWLTAADVLRLGKAKLEPGERAGESMQLQRRRMLCACQCPAVLGTSMALLVPWHGKQTGSLESRAVLLPPVTSHASQLLKTAHRQTSSGFGPRSSMDKSRQVG
jgi:hypothetical protein